MFDEDYLSKSQEDHAAKIQQLLEEELKAEPLEAPKQDPLPN